MQSIVSVITTVASAVAYERMHQLLNRNRLAAELFASRVNRLVIDPVTGFSVETWWDRYSRNWVTQTKDAEGNQVGSADYSGEKLGAAIAHLWALSRLFNFSR